MKKKKEFVYEYPYSKEQLLAKLNDRSGCYHNWCYGEYLISIKRDDFFFLGVDRGGHGGGFWYVARVDYNNAGTHTIRGDIVYNPDECGNAEPEKKSTRKEKISITLLCILLSPLFLFNLIIRTLGNLVFRIIKKRNLWLTTEEKLDRFMIEYLSCKKI